MYTMIIILFIAALFIPAVICDIQNFTVFVKIPIGQWRRIESKAAVSDHRLKKLILVAQHDSDESRKLQEMADSVSDPASVSYGHFMDHHTVYQTLLSKTTTNGDTLERWAKSKGLQVTRTTKNKQFLMVDASIDTIDQVFQTKLHLYEHVKTGKRVWRSASYQIPMEIHKSIAYIEGLSQFPIFRENKTPAKVSAKSSSNAPIILHMSTDFNHFKFYIQLICHNGAVASNSLCLNQFRGFQIKISNRSKTFTVPVSGANCEACAGASLTVQYYCSLIGLRQDLVMCVFDLNQNDEVPLYELHNISVRTRFARNKYSKYATNPVALQKLIDITPSVLRSLYNVIDSPTEARDNRSRQAIAGFDQYLNMKSFDFFANTYGTKFKLLFGKVYGGNFNDSNNDEGETSLDIQYMASMGSRIPVDYISSPGEYDDFLIDFFVQLAFLQEDETNVVPLVYSFSYVGDEIFLGDVYISVCEHQFMIMSLTGKTVFTASGDDGTRGFGGTCGKEFHPSYPSSSAYVTSVGATQFVKATRGCPRQLNGFCLDEVVASTSDVTRCGITSGGGFSNMINQPRYQQKSVDYYLKNVEKLLPPASYFNRSKRAFPDVSLVGHRYQVIYYDGVRISVDGTSASTPALAGLVSLIVDQRLKRGKKPLGLLNPLLYSLANTNPNVFYEITKGDTRCNTSPNCCRYGFVAAQKWDPATGLGSINHQKLMKHLIEA